MTDTERDAARWRTLVAHVRNLEARVTPEMFGAGTLANPAKVIAKDAGRIEILVDITTPIRSRLAGVALEVLVDRLIDGQAE